MLAKSQPNGGPVPSRPVTKTCRVREALVFIKRNIFNLRAYVCGVVGQLFKPFLHSSSVHVL